VAAVVLAAVGPGAVAAKPADTTCSLTQLTRSTTGASLFPSMNAAGTRIAFGSNADLIQTGTVPDHLELFVIDVPRGHLTQLTHSDFGGSSFPSINAAGDRIAFASSADLTGDNLGNARQVFTVETPTGRLAQISGPLNTSEVSSGPSNNASGTRIAFTSGDLSLFVADTPTGQLTQLTEQSSDPLSITSALNPSIDASGTRIVFESQLDLTGSNPNHFHVLYLVDTRTRKFTQLTTASSLFEFSFRPSINAAGTRIVFESNVDLTGQNPSHSDEIFLKDMRSGRLTQLTTAGGSFAPVINAGGNRIAFMSFANLTGGNPDGNSEVFLMDTTTGKVTQVTDTPDGVSGGIDRPSINAAGTRIVFQSFEDLVGQNPERNVELFLATCNPAQKK
jgi:Tol biopolymer transport system component